MFVFVDECAQAEKAGQEEGGGGRGGGEVAAAGDGLNVAHG